jgi:hypothetical protein
MIFSHQPARSKGDAVAHDGQADRAAATASSTSAGLPVATEANVSPEDGLTAAAGLAPPVRHFPLMYSKCSRTVLASRFRCDALAGCRVAGWPGGRVAGCSDTLRGSSDTIVRIEGILCRGARHRRERRPTEE